MNSQIANYAEVNPKTTYSFDLMLAGNLIILSKFLSCSASSANVCFREDVDFVSEPTVNEGMFFASFSLAKSRLSSVLNE